MQWTEAQRAIQQALHQAETEETGNSFAQVGTQDLEVIDPPGTGDERKENTASSTSQSVTAVNHPGGSGIPTEPSPAQPLPKQNPAPFYQWTNSGILVPTPIGKAGNKGENKTKNSKASFNIADFEGEEDPFENCELKVLNTMEELDKVLQASSLSSTQTGQSIYANGIQTGARPTDDLSSSTGSQPQFRAQSGTGHASQLGSQPRVMSLKDVEYPDLDDVGNSNSNSSGMLNTMTADMQHASRGTEHVQFINGGAHFSKTALPPVVPNAKCLPNQVNSSGNPTPYSSLPLAPLSQSTGHNSVKSFKDYMDQLNSFSHGQSPNGLVHNAAKANEYYQKRAWSTPPPNRLRSARSTPDLAGLEEMNMSRQNYPHSHSPPPFVNRTQTPPPRPSSGQVGNITTSNFNLV